MASQSYQLVMRSDPDKGKAFDLTKNEIYIGRDISNDIVINDAEVSRKHARVALEAGGYVLEDLGSTNGTFVNGQRLMGPHALRPGELIMLGENISLSFEAVADENSTLISAQAKPATPPPMERQAAPPIARSAPPAARPAPAPSYSGQVPQGPAAPYYPAAEPVEKKSSRNILWISCGVLLVLLCILVAGTFVFDQLNLYCTPPFNILFSFIYTCP
jgi:predicted component of type VI protein secretion system